MLSSGRAARSWERRRRRRSPDAGSRRQLREGSALAADQSVARVFSFEHGPDREVVRQRRRQVLQAVHREVDALRAQRLLQLACEESLVSDLREGGVEHPIADGLNHDALSL